ncbi:MAG TPA: sensor histidine kinase [Nocardioidaceae bacterium]|nr:sensor histidine kinase [Nocardioidaceae bacterium]
MVTSVRHTVLCRHDGARWVVELPRLGVTARVERLSDVEAVAREQVAATTGEDPAACRVVVELARPTFAELAAVCAAAREDPDQVTVEAVTLRRGLAQGLCAEGLDVSDVAALLGLSYARAVQLVNERPQSALRGAGRLPPHLSRRAIPPSVEPSTVDPAAPAASSSDLTGVKPHDTYRHEAVHYRSAEELRAATVPFVREALALGQPVMVALVRERLERLRRELGADAARVTWVDMAQLGANPARIIPAWRAFIEKHDSRPVRGIGEPVWAGRRSVEVAECQLHEALLNLAVEPETPLWLRCPYDASALSADVLAEAARSHPVIVDGDSYRGSTSYGGVDHARNGFAGALPEPTTEVEGFSFDCTGLQRGAQQGRDVASVRRAVQERAAVAGLSPARRADVALAVTEAANNSLRHGGGRGTFRSWRDDDTLTFEVRDGGHITDLLVGRRQPPSSRPHGRGLWLLHQLSDLAQVRSSPDGTVVRVTCWV